MLVLCLIFPILTYSQSSDPLHQDLAKHLAQLTETALTHPTAQNCRQVYNHHILFSDLKSRDKRLIEINKYIRNSASNMDKWSGETVSRDIRLVTWNMVKDGVFWVDFLVDRKAKRSIFAKKEGDDWKVYYVDS